MELLDQLSLMNNTTEKIVCPMPEPWDNLHKLICHKSCQEIFNGLENPLDLRRRLAEGYKTEIPYPIMLAEWAVSDENKRERLGILVK